MWVQCGCRLWGRLWAFVPAFYRAHSVQVVQGAGASGVLRCVFRPFVPLLLLPSRIHLEICLISRFKGVFVVVVWV